MKSFVIIGFLLLILIILISYIIISINKLNESYDRHHKIIESIQNSLALNNIATQNNNSKHDNKAFQDKDNDTITTVRKDNIVKKDNLKERKVSNIRNISMEHQLTTFEHCKKLKRMKQLGSANNFTDIKLEWDNLSCKELFIKDKARVDLETCNHYKDQYAIKRYEQITTIEIIFQLLAQLSIQLTTYSLAALRGG
jgi:hypothetical protein